MKTFRRFSAVILAIAIAVALPYSAHAENWFEAQASFFETIDGKFAPTFTIQTINYIDGKGIGLFLGKDKAAGPAISWRVFEEWWSPKFGNAVHLSASSDLWQGQDSTRHENATYQFDLRWFWQGLHNKMELSTPVQATFKDGQSNQWTFGVQFIFTPGRGEGTAATLGMRSIEDEVGAMRASDMARNSMDCIADSDIEKVPTVALESGD